MNTIKEMNDAVSSEPTPYAVHCRRHGRVYMTQEEYRRQITFAELFWECPICGGNADFDDENYEEYFYQKQQKGDKL